jgi:hypothetical protein
MTLDEELKHIPTNEEILNDIYKKYIWNHALIQYAKGLQVFDIDGKEYYISQVKNLQITFTTLDNNENITKYIEDLQGIKITDYYLEKVIE